MSEKAKDKKVWEKNNNTKNKQPSGWQPQAGDAEGMKKLWLGEKSRRSKSIERGGECGIRSKSGWKRGQGSRP